MLTADEISIVTTFKDLIFLSEGQSDSGDEPSFKIQNPSDLCSFLFSMMVEVIYL